MEEKGTTKNFKQKVSRTELEMKMSLFKQNSQHK